MSLFTVSLRPALGTPVTITATENFASLRVSSCRASNSSLRAGMSRS
jgi:hypothetical protein